ncbi:MAG: hypothetical protein JWQ30_195, partial [Sediminibacterium sp.]|nr:hypothetical protein [Sediminibacterium sp.]
TFNVGIGAALQYRFTERWFAEAGLGYISRKLNTTVFLNQGALPPPRQSFTMELVTTHSVAFRTIELPLTIGYRVIKRKKTSLFLDAGFTGNFLLNTYYEVGFKQYEGSYAKTYWQGYSVHIGMGADHRISKKITATAGLAYSLINTMKKDAYLFGQDEYAIALPHRYLRFFVGIKTPL